MALDPSQPLHRYVHRIWTADEGLPQNSVYAVVASSSGYLWLGTDEGLVRFDGLRFVIFDRSTTPELRDPFVFALHEARDGSLWAGTDRGGLTRLSGGRFTHYGTDQGIPAARVQAIADGRDGAIWVGFRGAGVARIAGGQVRLFTPADGLSSGNVLALVEDREGRLWVGTDAGLDRFDGGRFTRLGPADGLPPGGVRALHEGRDGRLWVGTIDGLLGARLTGGGLAVIENGVVTAISRGWSLPSSAVMRIREDRSGTIWLATAGGGIVCLRGDRVAHWQLGPSPSDDLVYDIAQDAEGNLWLGTAPGGLHRLRDSTFTTYTADDGLVDAVVESLHEDRRGVTWIGTHAGGVCRVAGATVTCLTTRDGLSHNRVNALLDDPDGTLWLGTQGGLDALRGGHVTRHGLAAGLPVEHVNAVMRDRRGALWVGTWGGGVAREAPRGSARFVPLGGAGLYVTSLLEDSGGAVWVGTTDGLWRWADDELVDMTRERGLPSGIEALYESDAGTLWIGTRRDGLYRYRDGGLAHYTARDGLYDNLVGTILEDGNGHFWFTCNKGIYRVPRAHLTEFAEGRRPSIESRAFDTADGLLNRECNFGQGRLRGRDGRLWFATVAGVAVVDPARVPRNAVPPPVHLERVTVDGEPLPAERPATLAYGRRRLEFAFAGLSLSAPTRLRYRYRLDGFDPGWIDGGEARSVQYTNLPPGAYVFRVGAANGDGVWSERDATFAVSVQQPLWRRPWFLVSLVGVAWLVVSAAGYRRLRAVRREQAQQAAFARELISLQDRERLRLASDLHDGVGQQLLIIGNWARLSLEQLHAPARARSLLQEIVETTGQALREIRTIARDLQPYDLEHVGVHGAIAAMAARVADASGLVVSTDLDEVGSGIGEAAAANLFRIVQEALNNVVKHAGATEARVTLRRRDGEVEIAVSDNGRGIPPDVASGTTGFGLKSLTERARLLGGTLALESTPRGTTVRVRVPVVAESPVHAS